MAKYIIEGGVPLKGKVTVPGAKNSGFKLMIASLLSDETSALSNISYIRDVISVKKIIEALGAKVDFEVIVYNGFPTYDPAGKTKVNVGGEMGYFIEREYGGGEDVIVKYKNLFYLIRFSSKDFIENNSKFHKDFNQLLSTFEFLSSTSSE